jgi:hypothetical protein
MSTEADLLAAAAQHAHESRVQVDEWIRRIRANPNYQWRRTAWGEALLALEAVKNLPAPAPPPGSVFAGKGLFTTSDAGSASNHPCDWVAVQMDPEGNQGVIQNNPARLCYWQARPTQAVVDLANRRGIPYIGQAENDSELDRCLALGPSIHVPKALVGNPSSWSDSSYQQALVQGWDLILEWYWNAQPNYTAPNADNYPRFVNVCFGIYSEGDPGSEGYVPQSKTVADYQKVWPGPYSCWKAEAMTDADWVEFNL